LAPVSAKPLWTQNDLRISNDLMAGTVKVPAMRGYTADKDGVQKRLRRIEGQIRGLQRMVDEDTYCIDVLTQISAAKSALHAVAVGLLEDHLAHCVVDAARAGDPSAKVKEASDAIARLVRS
jgi:DNA-binding FrmR family transcriptional regulator